MTRNGDIIEIQGAAEQHPISWSQVDELRILAQNGIEQILTFVDNEISFKSDNRLRVTLKDLVEKSL